MEEKCCHGPCVTCHPLNGMRCTRDAHYALKELVSSIYRTEAKLADGVSPHIKQIYIMLWEAGDRECVREAA